jgi:hypothetical protein
VRTTLRQEGDEQFGMSFNAILDSRLVVSEEIHIFIEGEFLEQPPEEQGRQKYRLMNRRMPAKSTILAKAYA